MFASTFTPSASCVFCWTNCAFSLSLNLHLLLRLGGLFRSVAFLDFDQLKLVGQLLFLGEDGLIGFLQFGKPLFEGRGLV